MKSEQRGVEGRNAEQKEKEPQHNVVVVDFLRHGATEYVENSTPAEEKAAMKGKYPRDLTPQGEEQVRRTAEEIIKKIDPAKEVVAFWSSPAWRAQGSEEIIREMLEEKGISVYRDSTIGSMRHLDQYDKGSMDALYEKSERTGETTETLYSRDPQFQQSNERFETQQEVRRRAERVYNRIRYLAEHADLKGKKLHLIGVSHYEFMNPMMEDIFGHKVEEGKGFGKGEDMTIQFDLDKNTEQLTISADFRGEHKEGIVFDTQTRKFKTHK